MKKPQPPEARKIKYSSVLSDIEFSIFGLVFKINKVKHEFFVIVYIISYLIALGVIVVTQNGDGLAAFYVVLNSGLILLFLVCLLITEMFKLFKLLIENWNKPI
jgi:phosphoglycerol transferase MdoB-like AlkP superfamily enzyme